jgi:hypothetical protein
MKDTKSTQSDLEILRNSTPTIWHRIRMATCNVMGKYWPDDFMSSCPTFCCAINKRRCDES